MNTLLLCLAGPMQSWGVQSRFSVRDSSLEPSKSGVIGLICAAIGRPRHAPIDDLAGMRMGVRVDREGRLSRDYHIAQNVLKAGGGTKATEPSARYYLADAIFLVGLEGDDLSLMEHIQDGLNKPVWPLYLGRKAFVPGKSIRLEDGLIAGVSLENALERYPYIGAGESPERLRLVIENPMGEIVRRDQPVSFGERIFYPRRIQSGFMPTPSTSKEVY